MTKRKIVDGRALLQRDSSQYLPMPQVLELGRIISSCSLESLTFLAKALFMNDIHGSDTDLLEEFEQSGQVPRLDSWLASELSSPKTLKQCPDLEQDVQAYMELCARSCVAPKGRRILAAVSRNFDLDRVRSSVITASTLIRGNSIKDLRDFTQRIRLALGAVPVAQRPDSRLMGEWLFHRVKHFRKLERYIEDIRESSRQKFSIHAWLSCALSRESERSRC